MSATVDLCLFLIRCTPATTGHLAPIIKSEKTFKRYFLLNSSTFKARIKFFLNQVIQPWTCLFFQTKPIKTFT